MAYQVVSGGIRRYQALFTKLNCWRKSLHEEISMGGLGTISPAGQFHSPPHRTRSSYDNPL
jgi:hypothetical protein